MLRRNVPIDLIAEVPGVFRCPIVMTVTFWQRLAGIRCAPVGHGVLLAASAVHAVGLKHPPTAMALNKTGQVLATQHLTPTTKWRHRGAAWILELPCETAVPSRGTEVRLFAQSSERPKRSQTRI